MIPRFLLALCLLVAPPAFAAPKKPAAPEGNRFLFVIETSSAMLPFDHAGRQAAFDLVYSGIDGQIHAGDTIGVWTFGESVHAGVFPMQVWQPEQKLQLAGNVGLFVKNQHYDSQAHFDRVIHNLVSLTAAVKDVNIVIISGQDAVWKGTSLDSEINLAYQKNAAESRSAKRPLITTLAARKGAIVNWSVTLAGDPISFPQRTTAGIIVKASSTPSASEPSRTASPSDPSSPTDGVAQLAHAPIVAPRVDVPTPAPVRNIIITSKKPAANPESEPSIVEAAVPAAVPESLPGNPLEAKEIAQPSSPPVAAGLHSSTSPPSQVSPQPVMMGSGTNLPVTPVPSAPANVAPTLLPALLPAPLIVAAREKPNSAAPLAMASPPPPEQRFTPRGFFLIGTALTGFALSLFMVRRMFRPASQPSFITRSIDRGN